MQYDEQAKVFYFIACKEYDKYLSIERSDKKNMEIRFNKTIEPDILSIFDFYVKTVIGDNGGEKHSKIFLNSVLDDEFVIDKVTYKEKMKSSCQGEDGPEEDIKYFDFSYSPIRAFSINWPYFAFSGFNNYLVIVNAFDKRVLRRVQVAPKEEKLTIN